MGLKAALAHFQWQMASTVLGTLLYDICETGEEFSKMSIRLNVLSVKVKYNIRDMF